MSVSITQLIVQLVLDAGVHHQDLIVFTTLILLFIYYKATRSINTQSHKALIFDSAFEVPSNFSVDISRGPMPASGEVGLAQPHCCLLNTDYSHKMSIETTYLNQHT